MLKCPECGVVNPEGSRTCICGLDLVSAFQNMPSADKHKYIVADKDVKKQHIQNSQPVAVTDIDMPFGSMIVFMVKWAIASIPAIIILAVIGAVSFAVITGILSGLPK